MSDFPVQVEREWEKEGILRYWEWSLFFFFFFLEPREPACLNLILLMNNAFKILNYAKAGLFKTKWKKIEDGNNILYILTFAFFPLLFKCIQCFSVFYIYIECFSSVYLVLTYSLESFVITYVFTLLLHRQKLYFINCVVEKFPDFFFSPFWLVK